ncbi:hypothetical protein FBU59_001103 [Linderina macrospora]|uniref:Uncharacterized protein n=1 Tax=Linderina macrospora TaxID=4868 RepID=A0ACC1JEX6_9FUNG|nr:hypothetical protein FBU59_001103 [Linderina macrospora]
MLGGRLVGIPTFLLITASVASIYKIRAEQPRLSADLPDSVTCLFPHLGIMLATTQAITLYVLVLSTLCIAVANLSKDAVDEEIGKLLGVRPDLANELALVDGGSGDDSITGGTDALKDVANGEVDNASNRSADSECMGGCKVTDQSCKARCLGVPGVAGRKMPRKQDINGNLPLNWRVAADNGALDTPMPKAVSSGAHCAGISAVAMAASMVLFPAMF